MYRYSRFSYFASRAARIVAHPGTFLAALAMVLIWLAAGPFVGYSNMWQVVFSIGATVVTFLLLFLIQHTQSREMTAIQLKLNDLIRASEGTHNALLDIEELTDRDYDQIKASYTLLAQQAREQLHGGKFRWATARVSMETFDSLLDAAQRDPEKHTEEAINTEDAVEPPRANRPLHAQEIQRMLDRITRMGTQAAQAPIALLSLMEGEKQWLKSQHGLPAHSLSAQGLPLSQFLCDQVALTGKPLLIEDVAAHPVAQQEAPLSDLKIGALAVFPLFQNTAQASDSRPLSEVTLSEVIGAFIILDTQVRSWTPTEIALLQDLTALAGEQYELLASFGLVEAAIPAQVSDEVGDATTPRADTDIPSEPTETILVVDDSQTNRLLLRQRLMREGYRVQTAASGAEAFACLKQEPVALVLLDIMMPGMDGEQVLEQMQQDAVLKQIPVVMISALDEQESVTRCLKMGARDYLLKPFDPAQLQARIRTYLHPELPTSQPETLPSP